MFTLKKGKGGGLYFLNETSACALKPVLIHLLTHMLLFSSHFAMLAVTHGFRVSVHRHLFHSKNISPLLFLSSR
jgi:hypothetical protein